MHSIEHNQTLFEATTTTYFERTVAVEESVIDIRRTDAPKLKTARDTLCTTKAAERGYVSDQLKVTGLPQCDLPTMQRAFKELSRMFDFDMDPATSIRLCSPVRETDPSGPDEFLQREVAAATRTRFDVFVTFKYIKLRDVILKGNRNTGRVRLSDVDLAFRNSPDVGNDLRVYELLAPDRYASFGC